MADELDMAYELRQLALYADEWRHAALHEPVDVKTILHTISAFCRELAILSEQREAGDPSAEHESDTA